MHKEIIFIEKGYDEELYDNKVRKEILIEIKNEYIKEIMNQ